MFPEMFASVSRQILLSLRNIMTDLCAEFGEVVATKSYVLCVFSKLICLSA